jgi:hypothetical protein
MTDKKNTPEDMGANISPEERSLLDESIENSLTQDNLELKHSSVDTTDDDGELLNENSAAFDVSGSDLDVPGAEDDDMNEEIGEEDEENNSYSLPDQS